jgi:hypothetical protein
MKETKIIAAVVYFTLSNHQRMASNILTMNFRLISKIENSAKLLNIVA